MIIKTIIRHNEYRDSVQLMRAASLATQIDGVESASAMMGTSNNKKILAKTNLLTTEVHDASANDIIISVKAKTELIAINAIELIVEKLTKSEYSGNKSTVIQFKSTRGALSAFKDANLVVISVPGEYAAREARLSLESGRNVFLFSNNVSLEDEEKLKLLAKTKNLIVMGPDCGTAILKGVGIGFANRINKGSIGLIGASGTGLQEVSSLIHMKGRGISHAIGTGSRDIKDSIGGVSTIIGLDTLNSDPDTKVIVIISKPPQERTMKKILDYTQNIKKPVIINFLGVDHKEIERYNLLYASTLEAAASFSCLIDQNQPVESYKERTFNESIYKINEKIEREIHCLKKNQQYIRGLYTGGTFAYEAIFLLSSHFPNQIYSNVSMTKVKALKNLQKSYKHTIIDLGDDTFTIGKPHPMIDQSYRKKRIVQEASDLSVAVLLLDFVLGTGAHPDPVGDLLPALQSIRNKNNYISMIAHVCGTDLDPQNYFRSIRRLEENGVITMPSNSQATKLAALIALRKKVPV